jgi:dihydrofolate reductase
MGKVRTGLAVSLDGFISGPNDALKHPWGSVASGSWPCETTGALVFGRRTFDLTHGWGGNTRWRCRSLL